MTDFDSSYDTGYGYDTSYTDLSNAYSDVSFDAWNASVDFTQYSTEAWYQGDTEASLAWQTMANDAEWYSNEAWSASWDAWYGPVNSEGYTAYDASMGYTSTDTSFIEPASSAGSTSMISDYDATSVL